MYKLKNFDDDPKQRQTCTDPCKSIIHLKTKNVDNSLNSKNTFITRTKYFRYSNITLVKQNNHPENTHCTH